jgi:uncharacterized protein YlxW (UPF0749 family)
MSCICQCWKDKELKLNCARCGGLVSYIKTQTINEEDEIKVKIQKLKNDLISKQADVFLLKQEIRELENL